MNGYKKRSNLRTVLAVRISFFLLLFCFACQEESDTVFTQLSTSKTNIDFKNLLRESEQFNVLTFGYFYNGGGVAIGDINNDGLDDIYFTGNMMASHLYLNKGNFEFEEIAASAGVRAEGLWNTGVTMVDINADGWLDIYVCRSAANLGVRRTNQLFINNRDLTFTESAAIYGLDDQGYSTQATFLDYDKDGDLDMYLLNHSVQQFAGFGKNLSELKHRPSKEYGDRLYENQLFMEAGEMIGRFFDVTEKAGINSTVLGFGLGVGVEDFNGDSWPDIYVSNDYNEEDYLYINQQDGTFKNEVKSMLDQSSLFSMGNDIADVNGDGLPDIISLDMLPESHERIQMTSGSDNYAKKQTLYQSGFHLQSMRNMLHINNGDGTFSELGQISGISNTDWSWASLVEDYDLDGKNDLFITNGYKADYTNMDFMAYAADQQIKSQVEKKTVAVSDLIAKIPSIDVSNYCFKNNGDLAFEDVTEEWGLDQVSLSNGASYADLDNDGDLDLVVNNINEIASIYRNNSVELGLGKSTTIKLKGPPTNPNAIGSTVKLYDQERQLLFTKSIALARGYQSSVSPTVIVADTLMTRGDKIEIQWGNGQLQLAQVNTTNKVLSIEYDSAAVVKPSHESSKNSQFEIISDAIDHKHQQTVFNDFDYQRLIPFKMSDRSAKLAHADVNGDGLEDVYLCGSSGFEGQLFLQRKDGKFDASNQAAFGAHKALDELNAIFFDFDGDRDKDLLTVSGSYQANTVGGNKLYVNNGKGIFSYVENEFSLDGNYSSVVCEDFNGDGALDLFLGGFIDHAAFPIGSESKLVYNNGQGELIKRDVVELDEILAEQIITDALSTDYDQDGDADLVIVGHWMPITICYNGNGEFDCVPIKNSSGLWNTVEVDDLDGDKFPDLVVGNFGMNSQLRATVDEPLKLYYDDFDKNGTIDPILCKTIGGKEFPFSYRDDLISQIPELKKRVGSYAEYANAEIQDLIDQEKLDEANYKIVEQLSSAIVINQGGKQSELVDLPWQAQQAPVYAICISDVDEDGRKDILLAGNQEGAMVQLGPSLSSKGTILYGNANNSYSVRGIGTGSLGIKGEVRDIIKLGENKFLFSRFRDSLIILNNLQHSK